MSNVKLLFCLFLPITIATNDYYGAKGLNITLICPYKKGSTGTLQWTYINASESGLVYSTDSIVNTVTLPPELYSRLSVTGNYSVGEYNLQIRGLRETDEGRYRCQNNAQQYVQGLYVIRAPETPQNFTALNPSESSIVVQWEAGYNGRNEQTFYVEYRIGSNIWMETEIPDTKQTGKQIYILKGLEDGTSYELRMYAENMFDKSLPTKPETIETIKGNKVSQSQYDIAAVAGGLSAVILLLLILNVVLLILLWKGLGNKRTKAMSASPVNLPFTRITKTNKVGDTQNIQL